MLYYLRFHGAFILHEGRRFNAYIKIWYIRTVFLINHITVINLERINRKECFKIIHYWWTYSNKTTDCTAILAYWKLKLLMNSSLSIQLYSLSKVVYPTILIIRWPDNTALPNAPMLGRNRDEHIKVRQYFVSSPAYGARFPEQGAVGGKTKPRLGVNKICGNLNRL